MAGSTNFNLNNSELVSEMRTWFFPNDRSIVLAPDTFIEIEEMTSPPAPTLNKARLFVKDNGAGKSQLVVIFASGAEQVIATEP